jgi:chaperonin GroES
MSKFIPLGRKVLIEEIKEEVKKEGSIIIPDTIAKIFSKGIIRYKSEEVEKVNVGDTVLFPSNAGNKISQDGKEMLLMNVEALEAII